MVISSVSVYNLKAMSKKRNKKSKSKYEYIMEAKIICYINPVPMNPVNRHSPKYVEGKIIYSDKDKTIGYVDGHCVRYEVKGRSWHGIKDDPKALEKVMHKIRELRYSTLLGAHHVNFYGGITGKLKYHIPV